MGSRPCGRGGGGGGGSVSSRWGVCVGAATGAGSGGRVARPVPSPPPFPVPLLSLDTWLVPRVTCREPFGWRFTAVLLGQAESLLAFCCRDLSEAALLVRNRHARPGE